MKICLLNNLGKSVKEIFSEGFIFLLLSLVVINVIDNMDSAISIISESVGIKSFILSFLPTIVISVLLFAFIGPCIRKEDREKYKDTYGKWRSDNDITDEKLDKVVSHYDRWLTPLNSLNVSFGVASMGVMTALIIQSFLTWDLASVKSLGGSLAIMFPLVVWSKMIKYAMAAQIDEYIGVNKFWVWCLKFIYIGAAMGIIALYIKDVIPTLI